jgi:predicted RNase H-like HicB family nuclease
MAQPIRYTAVIEHSGDDYNAYVPDLPGCGAVGGNREEVIARLRTAIEEHIRVMRADGDTIPIPVSTAVIVEVAA